MIYRRKNKLRRKRAISNRTKKYLAIFLALVFIILYIACGFIETNFSGEQATSSAVEQQICSVPKEEVFDCLSM